jgi:trk system potassium uptake protein TrkA
VACWTIKKIANTETICYISKPSLYKKFSSSTHDHYQTRYDIDSIIWPEQLLTQDIFRIISVPDALDVEFLASSTIDYGVSEFGCNVDFRPVHAACRE